MQPNELQMRLSPEIGLFLKSKIKEIEPNAEVYLFGSRTNLAAKGGDIDILVVTEHPLSWGEVAPLRCEFFTRFGWQKLDIVSFQPNDPSPFFRIIFPTALPL